MGIANKVRPKSPTSVVAMADFNAEGAENAEGRREGQERSFEFLFHPWLILMSLEERLSSRKCGV